MNDVASGFDEGLAVHAPRADPVVAVLRAATTEPFLVVDQRLRVRGWNDAAAELLGLAQAQAAMPRDGMALDRVLASGWLDATGQAAMLAAAADGMAGQTGPTGPLGMELRRLGARRWMIVFRGRPAEDAEQVDSLTGLPNRLALREALAGMARHMEAAVGGPAVLLVGLDRFRQVNDRLGHAVGDALLVAAAKRLRGAVRGADKVFRLAGDEFAVLTTKPGHAEAAAARLVDLLGRTYLIQGQVCSVGASVGIARAPADGSDGDELVRCADLALAQAKREGRNCVRVFRREMDARAQARHAIEADLRLALVRNQLELHYQAQVDLATRELAGFEALLRWRHPERGLVPPDAFIPIAEEIGLIVPFGEWVLRTACRDRASWPGTVSVAVNVSPLQLDASARLVQAVQGALAANGLPAGRLEIEITESALLRDQAASLATLSMLRGLGVRISMDDFGTGYSSLGQLRSFPFDKIKIDRSFVSDLSHSAEAVAMVRAVTTLGQSLGMTTTAEGVETADQAHRLGLEGCTYLQGYLISRPVPQDQVLRLIARQADEPMLAAAAAE